MNFRDYRIRKRNKLRRDITQLIILQIVFILLILYIAQGIEEPVKKPEIKKNQTSTGMVLSPPPPSSPPLYDVPLSSEEQQFVIELAAKYDFNPKMIFAMMSVESNYHKKVRSKTNDLGIMQVNEKYYQFYVNYDPEPYKLYNAPKNNYYDFKTNVITGINALRFWRDEIKKEKFLGDVNKKMLNCYNQGYKAFTKPKGYANQVIKEVNQIGRIQ